MSDVLREVLEAYASGAPAQIGALGDCATADAYQAEPEALVPAHPWRPAAILLAPQPRVTPVLPS